MEAYALTNDNDDEAVDSFYGDVESAMNEGTALFIIVMGKVDAKAGKKQVGKPQ